MHRFRRKSSSSSIPIDSPPTTPTSPTKFIKETVGTHSKTKDPKVPAVSSSAIALPIGSPSFDPSDTGADEPGSSKESGWRTAYRAARMAVDVARESSDMFPPLRAVLGALTVLIQNYDVSPLQISVLLTADLFLQQTVANAEQIRDIEERVQSLADVLASPVNDQDSGEKARRETLRKYVLLQQSPSALLKPHQLSAEGWLGLLQSLDHYPNKEVFRSS